MSRQASSGGRYVSSRGGSAGKVALILSSGRTGTQFLAHYFDANYDGVVARHEPPPARLLRMASHAHLAGKLSHSTLASLLQRKRRRFVDPLDAPLYIESNPFLSGFIDVVGDVWEDPIVVHVVRDPREHARSSLNHGTASGLKGLSNRFVPYWYPDVAGILRLVRPPSWLGRVAGVWRIFNQLLTERGPLLRNYHRLRYEDVFDESSSGLRALCEIVGLPFRDADDPRTTLPPGQRINAAHLAVARGWNEWPAEDCRELQQICAPLMQELGYGREPEWLARVDS